MVWHATRPVQCTAACVDVNVTQVVVMWLTDDDRDGLISRSELCQLHLLGRDYSEREMSAEPHDLATLVTALYLGFDRSRLRALLELQQAAGSDLTDVEAALRVSHRVVGWRACIHYEPLTCHAARCIWHATRHMRCE